MPTPERKERRRLVAVVWSLVAVGLIYMSGSLFAMNYLLTQNHRLVAKNTEFCQQRQTARSTIRYFFIKEAGAAWTENDQVTLDEGLAEYVPC